VSVSGKQEGYTRACGVGGTFPDLPTAKLWVSIGQAVAGGTWLIRREGNQWRVYSPSERARQLQDA
jgi:hypothetical protein